VDLDEDHKTAGVIVPERMLSLAIGKEGQNARLAAKLTGWRIDIKSALTQAEIEEMDEEEVARRAAAALRAEAAAGSTTNGHDPEAAEDLKEERRKVRANNTVVYQNATYGPLPEELVGETVRLRATEESIEIRTDAGRVLATYPVQESGGEEE
jgi:transcription termination/antitermination protein NusA